MASGRLTVQTLRGYTHSVGLPVSVMCIPIRAESIPTQIRRYAVRV